MAPTTPEGDGSSLRSIRPALISPKDAAEETTLTTAQLATMSKAGKFPQPVHISEKRIAYVREEVEAWIAARIAERKRTE